MYCILFFFFFVLCFVFFFFKQKTAYEIKECDWSSDVCSSDLYRVAEIVSIRLPDKPGELGKVTRRLADEEINIQYIYILGKDKGATDIALRVDDVENARIVLSKYLI